MNSGSLHPRMSVGLLEVPAKRKVGDGERIWLYQEGGCCPFSMCVQCFGVWAGNPDVFVGEST